MVVLVLGRVGLEGQQRGAGVDAVTGGDVDGGDGAGDRRDDRVLHLHGLDDQQGGARRDVVARVDGDREHRAGHRGGERGPAGELGRVGVPGRARRR
jgi:hypothetical protein